MQPSWLPCAEGRCPEGAEGFFFTRADEERVILFPEKVCKKPATRRSGKFPRLPGLGTAGAKGNVGGGGGSGMIGIELCPAHRALHPFPNRAGNFPALLMSPSWSQLGWGQEKSLPLEGKVAQRAG